MRPDNEEGRPTARAASRDERDGCVGSHRTADFTRLSRRDRTRLAARVAELDDLGRLMRERGTLAGEAAA